MESSKQLGCMKTVKRRRQKLKNKSENALAFFKYKVLAGLRRKYRRNRLSRKTETPLDIKEKNKIQQPTKRRIIRRKQKRITRNNKNTQSEGTKTLHIEIPMAPPPEVTRSSFRHKLSQISRPLKDTVRDSRCLIIPEQDFRNSEVLRMTSPNFRDAIVVRWQQIVAQAPNFSPNPLRADEEVVFISEVLQPQNNGESSVVRIKEERPDEAEIQELAARMVEANKAKMAAQAAVAAASPAGRPLQNQSILSYVSRPNSRTTPSSPAPATTPDKTEKQPLDSASQKGKFGWVMLGEEHLPYIQRGGDKYCAVRMVELKLLVKYLSYLNSDIYSCTCIRSYFITECEARLLTEINLKHCEGKFGRDPFTTKDLVVRMEDASEFYNFLELCYTKLMNPHSTNNSRCGFVRINNDSVVPYTVKDEDRFVPLFYFEGETETLKKRSTTLGAWDLAYLKFCCKVQGIRSELFANDSCQVISLADIKAYFPAGTKFDEFWPPKVVDTQLLVNKPRGSSGAGSAASWIKVPPGSTTPTSTDSTRIPSSNQVSNGWSPMMTTTPRYQPTALPVTTQQTRVSRESPYSVTTNSNNRSSYIPRVQTNTVNKYYSQLSHSAGHNSLPAIAPSPTQMVPQVQPPPLVRVTSANPTISYHSYSKDDWNTPYTCSPASVTYSCSPGGTTVPQSSPMLMSNGLMPPPHMQYAASHNNNNNSAQKYPPPLIPVNGTMSRYYGSSSDVIDLSSPPHSPQRSLMMNGKQTPQPAHQRSSSQSQSADNSGWSRLNPIPESPARQSNHFPFKMQKALVNGKMVPCINAKPYVYSELLMTVNDLLEHFFPGVSVSKCREVLQNVLQVTLYSGNLAQKSVLKENNKCKTLTEVLPLIQLKDVMQYMPQLKYIMERHMNNSSGESAAKRARIS